MTHRLQGVLRDLGRDPRVHPNGFLQLDLSEPDDEARGHSGGSVRLHVWHEELPQQQTRSSVHDHVFDMRSTVLAGRLSQHRFTAALDTKTRSHEIYIADYKKASESTLKPTGVTVNLVNQTSWPVDAGGTYNQPPFTFHDTRIVYDIPLCATVMEKVNIHDGDARVLVPLGEEPDNDFSRQDHPSELLWKIVDEAVDLMGPKGRQRLKTKL